MFRVILMCLLTCCSSFMPLKQSESNISEDHTQVVEKKAKHNAWQYGYSYIISSTEMASSLDQWKDFAQRRFGDDCLFFTGSPYFDSGSSVWQQYVDEDYIQDLRLVDIPTFIEGNNSQSYPYITIDSVRLSYTRNAGNHYEVYGVNFIYNGNENRHITFYLYDTYVNGSGLPVMQGYLYNSGYYYTATSFIYDEGFIYNNPSVFYDIWANPNDHLYASGYHDGEENGYRSGYTDGKYNGYQEGYSAGLQSAGSGNDEANVIFAGIMDVAFIPVNIFFLMFNYEVFGINIAGLVSALLTIAIILIIFRFIVGRKV